MTAEVDAVLRANKAFYEAFSRRDVAAMSALWCAEEPVSCIHPGHAPLLGREVILASWQSILTNRSAPQIDCLAPIARNYGDTAVVVCTELVNGAFLAATNVFVRRHGTWWIVHHHAGAAPVPPSVKAAEERKTLQ